MFPRDLRTTSLLHLGVVAAVMGVSTILFSLFEGISPSDSLYFVILLMTLIGANYTPHSAGGLILASTLAVVSVGVVISFIAQVLGPLALVNYWAGLKARRLSRMDNHIVICGFSDTGKVLLNALPKGEILVVVKEKDVADHLMAQGLAVVQGDYETLEVLGKAGVPRCRAVVAISRVDAENAFVCLTAKRLAPKVPVIATVSSEENKEKLDEVGADHIISPALLSARAIREALARSPSATPGA